MLYNVLEFIVRVESVPFQMFFQETKHMEITRRHVRAVGSVVKLLPLKLGPFRMCDPGHIWMPVIMKHNYTLLEQFLSFVFDGPV